MAAVQFVAYVAARLAGEVCMQLARAIGKPGVRS